MRKIIATVLTLTLASINQLPQYAKADVPAKLNLYTGTPNFLADNNS